MKVCERGRERVREGGTGNRNFECKHGNHMSVESPNTKNENGGLKNKPLVFYVNTEEGSIVQEAIAFFLFVMIHFNFQKPRPLKTNSPA